MDQQESIAGVRAAIALNGLRKHDIAYILGVTEQTLSMYLSERRRPPPEFEANAMRAVEDLTRAERLKKQIIEESKKRLQPAA